MPSNFARTDALGRHDVVRHFTIQGVANTQQFGQPRTRIGGLQQRAILISRRALQRALNGGFEVDHRAALVQMATISLPHDRATTRRQHDMTTLGQHINDVLLALTETGLTLDIENPRDIGPRTRLNFMVGIKEFPMQQLCELPPDGGLARAHGPDQINVLNARRQHLTSHQHVQAMLRHPPARAA